VWKPFWRLFGRRRPCRYVRTQRAWHGRPVNAGRNVNRNCRLKLDARRFQFGLANGSMAECDFAGGFPKLTLEMSLTGGTPLAPALGGLGTFAGALTSTR
jgi:hypothetical protein